MGGGGNLAAASLQAYRNANHKEKIMGKLGLKALALILKKICVVANYKFATKDDLNIYQNPHFEGSHLTFPSKTTAKMEGSHLVLTE